jgi:hypothetical protein
MPRPTIARQHPPVFATSSDPEFEVRRIIRYSARVSYACHPRAWLPREGSRNPRFLARQTKQTRGNDRIGPRTLPSSALTSSPDLRLTTLLIPLIFFHPRLIAIVFARLLGFGEKEIFHHQVIHFGSHEAAIGVGRAANDRLPAHIK